MVPAASHRIPRVPWYLRTPLEGQSTFAYRAVTAYGGPFQGPSASGWFGNFAAIRQDGLRLVQPPHRNGCRLPRDARLGCSLFARHYYGDGLSSSAYYDDSVRPVPATGPMCSARSAGR